MTAQEITDCLAEINDYLKKTMPQDVPNPYENWAKVILEVIEIIRRFPGYWPDK